MKMKVMKKKNINLKKIIILKINLIMKMIIMKKENINLKKIMI